MVLVVCGSQANSTKIQVSPLINELYIFYYGNNMNNMKSYKTFSFSRNYTCLLNTLASLVPQMVKNPPAMQDTWVWSLGQEDPLEESMATHSSILAWRIPWTEEPNRLQSVRSEAVHNNWSNLALTHMWWDLLTSLIVNDRFAIQTNIESCFIPEAKNTISQLSLN